MEQSPSGELTSHSAVKEMPRFLWNPKVHYRVHNSSPLVSLLSHMHPVHTFPPYFPTIHCSVMSSNGRTLLKIKYAHWSTGTTLFLTF